MVPQWKGVRQLTGPVLVMIILLAAMATMASAQPLELVSPNEQEGGVFGYSVSGFSDVNGDGLADVIVGSADVAMAGTLQVYFKDFESAVGPEWSSTSTDVTPVGNRRFLGRFAENYAVSLSLAGLPAHLEVTLSFDLFVIQSWDGNWDPGPDLWSIGVQGGPTLLNTTFSNHYSKDQSYPANYLASYPAGTGAAETNTLGYSPKGNAEVTDCVYPIEITFAHASDSIAIVFSCSELQELSDESWGLDNVSILTLSPVSAASYWEIYK